MSDIYVFNCILTSDHQNKTTFILSSENTEIVLPVFKIDNPRFIYNQIRYDTKNLFVSKKRIPEEIIVSYIEVENNFLIEYIEHIQKYNIDLNKDIIVLSSIILGFKDETNLFWKKYDFSFDTKNEHPLKALVDYTIQRNL